MRPTPTSGDYERIAKRLGCNVATVKAVSEVESLGAGFLHDGRPKILFERHKFHQRTGGSFSAAHPDISNPVAGGYGASGAPQYDRLYRALQLDADAAVMSASWGAYQIMGFNWQACGEKSLTGFLLAMHHSEVAQLNLFAEFVLSQGLADELRRHDWPGFARRYNGPAYAQNRYDTKLAAAYRKHGGAVA